MHFQKIKYPYKFSVAPMVKYTDLHCHFFYRQLTKKTLLYTEMLTTNQIIYKFKNKNIQIYPPTALQLAGNNVYDFLICSQWAEKIGFQEININLGCPSKNAKKGNFGIFLMKKPKLVFEIIKNIYHTVSIPISIKIRLGITKKENFEFLKNFIEIVSQKKYCIRFIIHARNADLTLLSTRKNRTIPPLNYLYVYKIKKYFPHLIIVLNGGLKNLRESKLHLKKLNGIMIGREIYKNPLLLTQVDHIFFQNKKNYNILKILNKMMEYTEQQRKYGIAPINIIKHFLNIFNGIYNSKNWKKYICEKIKYTKNLKKLLHHSLKIFPSHIINSLQKY
ncbi:tRNA dihydrouridine(20/20a) synthase DusA [Buchnera aphidicola]|uniref:tRNA-dihydrouridine synthase n=1 Tax=Buchnera aphidicola subsp. Tuberolachnus salignus TaxID=98804 RepID=A0A160SX85_BUCTT|nr:tRNA dihydrouridine(20/20a) synthase DusA [Buchnera aphidicola]CUR53338.1 tRNA-dihydrouridine synthase A [Buchnera aphidicola (Tuberolachnus salignus)]